MKLPKGKTEMVMGTVSITFLPYLSERFPTNGITSNDPNPMICIYTNTYNFIIIILYICIITITIKVLIILFFLLIIPFIQF